MNTLKWWWKALSVIPKISKEEWDQLDVVTKWLIMTRSAVTTVTIFSSIIGGLFAWRFGTFHWGLWIVVTLGLFIAHGTNNILNDYTDYSKGVDTDNYFRAMYGPHPLVHGFHDKATQIRYFIVSGVIALSAGIYTYFAAGKDVNILILTGVGAIFLLFYTYPMKYFALGEFSIFLIWGPVLIGGVFYVMTGEYNNHVILASIPIGLSVMSINLGKHIDKMKEDKAKNVHTLPVVIGEKAARYLDLVSLVLIYVIIIYLVVVKFYTPVILIVLFAAKPLMISLAVLTKPKPDEPPAEWTFWPIWFAGFTFGHNRRFTMLFMAGLLIDTILRVYVPGFWAYPL
ncbi:prenyltransferase [bacterium]|nr:prenyltransferase [bacterium]